MRAGMTVNGGHIRSGCVRKCNEYIVDCKIMQSILFCTDQRIPRKIDVNHRRVNITPSTVADVNSLSLRMVHIYVSVN